MTALLLILATLSASPAGAPPRHAAAYIPVYSALLEDASRQGGKRDASHYCLALTHGNIRAHNHYTNPSPQVLERLVSVYSNVHGVEQCDIDFTQLDDRTPRLTISFQGKEATILLIDKVISLNPEQLEIVAGTLDSGGASICNHVMKRAKDLWLLNERKDCVLSCN